MRQDLRRKIHIPGVPDVFVGKNERQQGTIRVIIRALEVLEFRDAIENPARKRVLLAQRQPDDLAHGVPFRRQAHQAIEAVEQALENVAVPGSTEPPCSGVRGGDELS